MAEVQRTDSHERHRSENHRPRLQCRGSNTERLMRRIILIQSLITLLFAATAPAGPHWTEAYNVVWTTPSKDAAGSMPLGNGEVGINLWVERDGDLLFYISRNDS